VIRLGGQSMFLAKLGVCDVVSSLWPMRVNPGTHTRTTTASRTEALARKYRYDRPGIAFNKGTFIYCSGVGQKEARETLEHPEKLRTLESFTYPRACMRSRRRVARRASSEQINTIDTSTSAPAHAWRCQSSYGPVA